MKRILLIILILLSAQFSNGQTTVLKPDQIGLTKLSQTVISYSNITGVGFTINWNYVGANNYVLYENTTNNFSTASVVQQGLFNSIIRTGKPALTTYYHWVVSQGFGAVNSISAVGSVSTTIVNTIVTVDSNRVYNSSDSTTTKLKGTAIAGTYPIASYLWTQLSGPTASIASPTSLTTTVSGLGTVGVYVFNLGVTDTNGNIVNATTSITQNGTLDVFTARMGDFSYNLYRDSSNLPTYRLVSAFSDVSYNTTATTGIVNLYSNIRSLGAYYYPLASISIFVNGVFNQTILATQVTAKDYSFSLPAGSKIVSFRTGFQNGPTSVSGTFINKVMFPPGSTTRASPQNGASRIVVIGNSISNGALANIPEVNGWLPLARSDTSLHKSIAEYGWGSASATYLLNTKLNEVVSNLTAYFSGTTLQTIYITLGTNDFGLNVSSAESVGGIFSSALPVIHAALPSAQIIVQSPITRTDAYSSSYNGFGAGNTISDYRAAIKASCQGLGYVTFVDGLNIVAASNIGPDGVHPTTAGHLEMKKNILPYLKTNSVTLSNLTTSAGSLYPAFNTGATNFAVQYTSSSTVTVTPTAVDPTQITTVNNSPNSSGVASQPIDVSNGNVNIPVVTTSSNGIVSKSYNINVIGNQQLKIAEFKNLVNVSSSSGALVVNSATAPAGATLTQPLLINGSAKFQMSGAISKNNAVVFMVDKFDDGNYKWATTIGAVSPLASVYQFNGTLNRLSGSSTGTATSIGTATAGKYYQFTRSGNDIILKTSTDDVTYTTIYTFTDAGSNIATLYIKVLFAAPVVGAELTNIKITSPVNPNADATLSALTVSSGVLSPTFTPSSFIYSVEPASGVTSVTVTPTVNMAGATISVNGAALSSGSASPAIDISSGSGQALIVVTAKDGNTQQTYQVVFNAVLNASFTTLVNTAASGNTINLTTAAAPAGATVTRNINGTGSYIQAQLSSTLTQSNAVVLALSSTNDGNYNWANANTSLNITPLACIYQASGTLRYSNNVTTSTTAGTAVASQYIRLQISGSDVLARVSTDGVSWTTVGVIPNAVSGLSNVYGKVVFAAPATGQTLTNIKLAGSQSN